MLFVGFAAPAVFGLDLALMLSVINVYFRDTTHFVGIFIQLWFYATPVIYPITLVTQGRDPTSWVHRWHVLDIYQANPALYFIETIKDMLYTGAMPAWTHFVYAVVIALATLWIGNAVFGGRDRGRAHALGSRRLAAVGTRGAAHGSRLRVSGEIIRVAHLGPLRFIP